MKSVGGLFYIFVFLTSIFYSNRLMALTDAQIKALASADDKNSDKPTTAELCARYKKCGERCSEIADACASAGSSDFSLSSIATGAAGGMSLSGSSSIPVVQYASNCMNAADFTKVQNDIAGKMKDLSGDIDKENDKAVTAAEKNIENQEDGQKKIIDAQKDLNKELSTLSKDQRDAATAKLKTDASLREELNKTYDDEGKAQEDALGAQAKVANAMQELTNALNYGVLECRQRVKKTMDGLGISGQSRSQITLVQQSNWQRRLKSSINQCYQEVVTNAHAALDMAKVAVKTLHFKVAGIQTARGIIKQQQKDSDASAIAAQQQSQQDAANAKQSAQQTIANISNALQQKANLNAMNLQRINQQITANQSALNSYNLELSTIGENQSDTQLPGSWTADQLAQASEQCNDQSTGSTINSNTSNSQ